MPSGKIASDFREYRRNRAPADWSPWVLSDTLANIGRAPTDTVDRQYLECWLADGKTPGSLAGYSFEPAGDIGDCECMVKFVQGGEAAADARIIALRAGGSEGAEDCVLLSIQRAGGQTTFSLAVHDGGIAEPVTSFNFAETEIRYRPIRVRWRIEGTGAETLTWLRAWLEGDPEPLTWQIEEEPLVTAPATGRLVLMAGDTRVDHRFLAFSLSFW